MTEGIEGIEDFFSKEEAEKIKKDLLSFEYGEGEVDREGVEPVGQTAILEPEDDVYKMLTQKIEKTFNLKDYELDRIYVNLFKPEDRPYYHADLPQDKEGLTCIYYPNSDYKYLDDLGETQVVLSDSIRSIPPISNFFFAMDSRLIHRANSMRDKDRYTVVTKYIKKG